MSKVYCVGGFLSGESVDFYSDIYTPISVNDHRDYYSLSAKEILSTEEPRDKYFIHTTNVGDFYIWNNDDSLKNNIINNYINRKI